MPCVERCISATLLLVQLSKQKKDVTIQKGLDTMTLLLLTKRQLKKPALWLILLLIPCFAFAMSHMAAQADAKIAVALYAKEDDAFLQSVTDRLAAAQDGMFTFYLCDSRDSVYKDVATGKAECGYLFADGMLQTLDAGRRNNLIDVIVSSDSLLSPVVNEIVYSAFFESYSLHMLQIIFHRRCRSFPFHRTQLPLFIIAF